MLNEVGCRLMLYTFAEDAICDGDSFTYRFAENESRVYFAHHMLYHPEHFSEFAKAKGFEITELCKSRKGRSVPCVKLGIETN